ncbi:putative two-component system sensor kinase [Actinoplanes missouriensis 431]|uniref:histidine kinase n=1 Tax=Actinoplanes missouriensis (strain ATCC 14538 / DSM 43046 / CBS 188.64 / JCM 3121 / NBRC 102363 / NCIMB 12654 / NRRL B-3342 / UNCC 431) TaxID=512565 RepID=I0H8B5_ACTM4|nr:HAMP domain-containing sensor histidine kinase [Actinoplanes missouriensis]BAL89252.1 putative two-component system sensor kinase [Actinoplanes missouriensis 431]
MRKRLALLVAGTTVLVLLAFLVPLAVLVRDFAEDRALSRAGDAVQTIVPLVGDVGGLRRAVTAQAVPVTVFLPDGSALGAPAAPTPAVRLAAARGRALTVTTDEGRELVVPVVSGGRTTVVRTLVTDEALTHGVTRAWLTLAGLGLALVLLGLLVADRLARSITRPITELSSVSHRLANAELSARAAPSGPRELREVAGALNHLAGRIQELLTAEREQLADLSHRLRTPLTALRLEAESLRDPEEAARVAAATDQLARAVTAVIQQARRPPVAAASCDAAAVVRDRVAFWAVLAEDTGRALTQSVPAAEVPVGVAADDLGAALDALLGNVFAHTPEGTGFAVTLEARPEGGAAGGAVLTVADAGPGFAESAARRGVSEGGSTGLGLDIARRVAVSFEVGVAAEGGAEVRLGLPGAAG